MRAETGRIEDARTHVDRCHEILQRYGLVGDQAECLHEWGRALARADDTSGAAERLEAALALYRRHGAGAAWLDRWLEELRVDPVPE